MTSEEKVKKFSKIATNWQCYICQGNSDLELHHCLSGSDRKKADEDGLFVALCHHHHRLLHDKGEHEKELKALAERSFISGKVAEGYTEGQARGIFLNRYGKHFDY